jgi:uncharacterized Rmd1/YagE family protein
MRCRSYCLGNELKLPLLAKVLKRSKIKYQHFGDVLVVDRPLESSRVYYFSNGSVVTWHLPQKRIHNMLRHAKKYTIDAFQKIEQDEFSYQYAEKSLIKPHGYFNVDMIHLTENAEDQLAISYALAQSVKLQAYEQLVESMISHYAHLIQNLAKYGTIKVPKREIPKIMGRIFLVKSSINLKSEYLNLPKYFWEHCSLEPEYKKVEKYMDIQKRVDSLNQKLDLLNEIFDMLDSHLQHRHSSFLDIIIIALIAIEIIFSILELARMH